jgi:efflux transporter, outer membrane factor (OMF) lipoprotein, NodT family
MYLQNIIKSKISFICLSLLIFFLSSCKILQPYKQPDIVSEEKLFRELAVNDSTNIADIPWKSLFTDKLLQNLIEEAINNNPDLQIAITRMKKAEANLKQSKASLFPTLNAFADASFQSNNAIIPGVPASYQLYGVTSWEADIWGRLRSAKRANLALFLESEAYKRAVQTQLIANVADSYYTLMAFDAKLRVTEKTIENRNSDVETMKIMKDNDLVTGADLVQSQANMYSAKVTIPEIKQSIYETENALSVLLGRNPGPITRGSLDEQEISPDLKTGIPAQLLANRPDVQEAEYQFRYGFEMTNVARKYFYPSLTISATGGITSTDLSKLFNASSVFWNLVGGLTQPILNQGQNKQRLRIAQANQQEYLIAFKQTVLTAGQEVANAMHGYQSASEKITLRASQIDYLEKSVNYTMELLKYTSSTNYTDVLTSEVNLLSAQLNSINDKLQQLQAVLSLYQSLGGGWKQ